MNIEIKKMMSVTMIAIMLMATGVTAVSAAGMGAYGSQVVICELDNTYELQPLAAIMSWNDVNANLVVEVTERVYLDADGDGLVTRNDIRITPIPIIDPNPGSYVQQSDIDFGDTLTSIGLAGWNVRYINEIPTTPGPFDLGDQVILGNGGPLNQGELRISRYMGHIMGDWVQSSDPDVIAGSPTPLIPFENYAYYDLNGNDVFNSGEPVLIDSDGNGLGTDNDVRLTILDACTEYYLEGTKIMDMDMDSVQMLVTNPEFLPGSLPIRWSDADGLVGYSSGDPIYIDQGPTTVSTADVRLTAYANNNPGSQVKVGDGDIGNGFNIPNMNILQIRYVDMTGDGYTLDDPVILDTPPINNIVSVNDLILSEGEPSSGVGAPGTKIPGSHSLMGFTLHQMSINPTVAIQYFDTNGDVSYTLGDTIFLDVGIQNFASVNDVRLSRPTFSFPFGSKVVPDDIGSVDGLIPIPFNLRSWDIDANGFDDGDVVYLCTWGVFPWSVDPNYIRLTPHDNNGIHYDAGSVVVPLDNDVGHNLEPLPQNLVRYHDRGVDGITFDDPIFIDADGSGGISEHDVRLTPYGSFVAGSMVANDGSDSLFGKGLNAFAPAGGAQFGFVDVNSRGANFDANDHAYLDIYGDNFATTHDVRLTYGTSTPPTTCPADLNSDSMVNFGDVLVIIGAWGSLGGPADLNLDSIVNFGDVLVVIGAWGPCP